ncbi:MAG: PAS domain-containing protein [Anaerolineae bacterium]|nr:PAS domain-containing protein [Anaerolineae bacterium]
MGSIQRSHHLSQVASLFQRFTEPHPSVVDQQTRYALRLVAAVSLISLISGPLYFFAEVVLPLALILTISNTIINTGLYALTRTKWYRWSIILTTVACMFGSLLVIAVSDAPPVVKLCCTLVPLLLYSYVWRIWLAISLTVLNLIGANLILMNSGVSFRELSLISLIMIISAVMINLSAFIRQQLVDALTSRTAQLEESEARFRGAIEGSFDAVFLLGGVRDANGKLVDLVVQDINERAKKMFNKATPLPIKGSLGSQIMPGFAVNGTLEFYAGVLNKRSPSDLEFMMPIGLIQPAWVRQQVVPIADRDSIAVIMSDISERKLTEERLHRQEYEFRALTENLPYQVGRLDRDHRFLYVNGALARAMRRTPESIIGQRIEDLELILPSTRTTITAAIDEAFASTDNTKSEYVYEIKGRENIYETRFVPERDDNGVVQTILSIVIDVTNARQAEKQRVMLAMEQEKIRLLRQFVSDASHDLMTPLAVIKNSLYLMREIGSSGRWQGYADQVARQTEHLETMIRDMLLLVQLEDNAEENYNFQRGDLNVLAAMFVRDYQPIVYKKNQHVRLECAAAELWFEFDSYKVMRVLTNLVHNAVKFTPEGGEIKITTQRPDEDHVGFEVTDTGCGISESDLPHVFDRFFKGKSHRPNEGGSGLGLSIAKRIVQAHHGEIVVSSSLGVGTTFRVILPSKQSDSKLVSFSETNFHQSGK